MDNNTCKRLFADHKQINNCKCKLKATQKSFYQLSSILALAGNEVRLKIVYLLEEEKELCPCDLADILGMSIPAVSQHTKTKRRKYCRGEKRRANDLLLLNTGKSKDFKAFL